MAPTLKSVMTSDAAAGGVWLPVDSDGATTGFNELGWFYPEGNFENRVQINMLVDQSGLAGTNESAGDGVILDRPAGESDRESIKIDLPSSVSIRRNQLPHAQDIIETAAGLHFKVQRIIGWDADMQTVLCVRQQRKRVRNLERSG